MVLLWIDKLSCMQMTNFGIGKLLPASNTMCFEFGHLLFMFPPLRLGKSCLHMHQGFVHSTLSLVNV